MGLPSINIVFREQGITAVKRSEKGVVGLILKDAGISGDYRLTGIADIPTALGAENKAYIERCLVGYINPPREVLLYIMDGTNKTLTDALAYFATQMFDYLAAPPDCSAEDATTIATWIKSERAGHHNVKAVLPNTEADCEGIVNFTGAELKAGNKTFTAAEYCSRIAGIIAGTPMTISCTYAPLLELSDIKRLTKAEADTAIDSGKLILVHDGEKAKIGRGVNSFVTTTAGKSDAFKKIKLIEAMDMIETDIRATAQDNYIGKFANSYDNKCLLIMAIKGYLEQLELIGILERGTSAVEIDLAAQEGYLKAKGIDTSKMSGQEIKEAGTGSSVFLRAKVRILDAIEDVDLKIRI